MTKSGFDPRTQFQKLMTKLLHVSLIITVNTVPYLMVLCLKYKNIMLYYVCIKKLSYSVVNANISTCVLLPCHVSSCCCVSPDNIWRPVLSHDMSHYMRLFNSKHYFLPCHTAWRYLTTAYCFISVFTLLCITVQLQVEFSQQFAINMQHDDDGRKSM